MAERNTFWCALLAPLKKIHSKNSVEYGTYWPIDFLTHFVDRISLHLFVSFKNQAISLEKCHKNKGKLLDT